MLIKKKLTAKRLPLLCIMVFILTCKEMHIFFQVATVGPTLDWFTQRTGPSSVPPFETTSLSTDIIVPKETDEDNSLDRWEKPTPTDNVDQYEIIENEIVPNNGRGSSRHGNKHSEEVTSENLWERTEVLAGKSCFWCNMNTFSFFFVFSFFLPKKYINLIFFAVSSCNSMWSSWLPLRCFPAPPPGLPYEEEGRRQL